MNPTSVAVRIHTDFRTHRSVGNGHVADRDYTIHTLLNVVMSMK